MTSAAARSNQRDPSSQRKAVIQSLKLVVTVIGTFGAMIAISQWLRFDLPASLKTPFYFACGFCLLVTFPVALLVAFEFRLPENWRAKVNRFKLVLYGAAILAPVVFAGGAFFNERLQPDVRWFGPVKGTSEIPEFLAPLREVVDGDASIEELIPDLDTRRVVSRGRGNEYRDADYVVFYSSAIRRLPKSVTIRNLGNAKIGIYVLDSNDVGNAKAIALRSVDTTIDLSEAPPITGEGRLVVIVFPLHSDEADKLRSIVSSAGRGVQLENFVTVTW